MCVPLHVSGRTTRGEDGCPCVYTSMCVSTTLCVSPRLFVWRCVSTGEDPTHTDRHPSVMPGWVTECPVPTPRVRGTHRTLCDESRSYLDLEVPVSLEPWVDPEGIPG